MIRKPVHQHCKNLRRYLKFAVKEMGAMKFPFFEKVNLEGMDGTDVGGKNTSTRYFIISGLKNVLKFEEIL